MLSAGSTSLTTLSCPDGRQLSWLRYRPKPLSPKHRSTFLSLQHAAILILSVDSGFVDIVRCFSRLPIGFPPGGDPLVDGVEVIPAAAFGQVRLPVEDVHGDVVGGILLGSLVTDYLAVARVAAQGEC